MMTRECAFVLDYYYCYYDCYSNASFVVVVVGWWWQCGLGSFAAVDSSARHVVVVGMRT